MELIKEFENLTQLSKYEKQNKDKLKILIKFPSRSRPENNNNEV